MNGRKWYQGLTHTLNGEFSSKQTIISASIIAAVAGIGCVIDKFKEKGTWQQTEDSRRAGAANSLKHAR